MYCWGAKQAKYSQLFPFHNIHALSWNFGSLLKTHTSLSKPDIFGKLEKSPVIHPGNFKALIHYSSRGSKTENQIFAKRNSECRKIWEKYYSPSHYSNFKAFMHWQVWEFGMGKKFLKSQVFKQNLECRIQDNGKVFSLFQISKHSCITEFKVHFTNQTRKWDMKPLTGRQQLLLLPCIAIQLYAWCLLFPVA